MLSNLKDRTLTLMDSYILQQILICNKMRIFFLHSRYLVWVFSMPCLIQTCLDYSYIWCKSKSWHSVGLNKFIIAETLLFCYALHHITFFLFNVFTRDEKFVFINYCSTWQHVAILISNHEGKIPDFRFHYLYFHLSKKQDTSLKLPQQSEIFS